jgi:hypothetical protein
MHSGLTDRRPDTCAANLAPPTKSASRVPRPHHTEVARPKSKAAPRSPGSRARTSPCSHSATCGREIEQGKRKEEGERDRRTTPIKCPARSWWLLRRTATLRVALDVSKYGSTLGRACRAWGRRAALTWLIAPEAAAAASISQSPADQESGRPAALPFPLCRSAKCRARTSPARKRAGGTPAVVPDLGRQKLSFVRHRARPTHTFRWIRGLDSIQALSLGLSD